MTLSTIGVLCQLGATVRLRDELESWLPGFLPEGEQEPAVRESEVQEAAALETAVLETAIREPEVQGPEVQELAGDAPLGA